MEYERYRNGYQNPRATFGGITTPTEPEPTWWQTNRYAVLAVVWGTVAVLAYARLGLLMGSH